MATDLSSDLYHRLSSLGKTLSLPPTPRLDDFVTRFSPFLSHFAEIGVELVAPRVCALTFGTTTEFREAVEAQLRADNFPAQSIEHVRELQKNVDEWMVSRVDVLGKSDDSLGLYFRKSITIAETMRLLNHFGVSTNSTTVLNRIAGILQTGTTHIFASQLRPSGENTYKAYIQPGIRQPEVLHEHLRALFEELSIVDEHLAFFLDHHMALATELCSNVYVSFFFDGNSLRNTIKLDYFHVPLGPFSDLLKSSGYGDELKAQPVEVGEALGFTHAEHVGVLFGRSSGAELTTYFPFQRSG